MAIVKIKLTKKVNNVVNDYYPKTSADNVVYDSNNTVEDKLNAIETTLTAHAVTNKGSSFSNGLYKITINGEGHVTAATPVTKSDITELGIPDAAATQTALNGKQSVLTFDNAPAEQSENPVKSSGIYYALAGKISTSAKGVNGGVAELDANGKVPSSQLPSYVDDVLSYNSASAFPATGEDGKIYIAKDTNLSYRWTGSDYAVISPSLALGNTSSTAYRGDWGAQDRAAIGTLTSLQTTAKSDLVAAINEIKNVLTFDSTPTENSTNPVTSGGLFSALSGKVDAEANKGLSTNDYTTAEKTKLSGIESGAEANVQSDWNQTDTTADDFIKNKPTNASASAAGLMSAADKTKLDGQGVVLWESSSGAARSAEGGSNTIQLSESLSGYRFVEVDVSNGTVHTCARAEVTNGETPRFSFLLPTGTGTGLVTRVQNIGISTSNNVSTLTIYSSVSYTFSYSSGSLSITTDAKWQGLYHKIVGYK